jgi:hypothetical protein
MKLWWCMECQAKVGLGKHGRCEVCESEAVDLAPEDNEITSPVSVTSTDSGQPSARASIGLEG